MPISDMEGFPTPSLIDRLSAEEPDFYDANDFDASGQVRRQTNKTKSREAAKRYQDAVRRDLEWLFNTRRVKDDRIAKYPQLQTSVYYYGIPDPNSEDPSRTHDRNELLRNMQDAIAHFDRRLQDIDVQFVAATVGSHLLQFEIAGVVLMDPAPEQVMFQTSLDPSNGELRVR
jgi:type VI secretion system protein ImpF